MRASRAEALVKNPDGAVSPLAVMALTAAGLVAVMPGSADVVPIMALGDLNKPSPPAHPALPFSRRTVADQQVSGNLAESITTEKEKVAPRVADSDLIGAATVPVLISKRDVPAGLVQVMTPAERPAVPLLAAAAGDSSTLSALAPAAQIDARPPPSKLANASPRSIVSVPAPAPTATMQSQVSLLQSATETNEIPAPVQQETRLASASEAEARTGARFAAAFPAVQSTIAGQGQDLVGPVGNAATIAGQVPRLANFSDRKLERTRVTISAAHLPLVELQTLSKADAPVDGNGNTEGELTDRRSPAAGRNRLTNSRPTNGEDLARTGRIVDATRAAAFVAAPGRNSTEPGIGDVSGKSSRSIGQGAGQSAVSEYRMTSRGVEFSTLARTHSATSGRVRLLIADDENIMVRLSDVLGLVGPLMPQGQFDRLAGSAQAQQFISLNDLRAAGIPVRFQKNDELEIGAF